LHVKASLMQRISTNIQSHYINADYVHTLLVVPSRVHGADTTEICLRGLDIISQRRDITPQKLPAKLQATRAVVLWGYGFSSPKIGRSQHLVRRITLRRLITHVFTPITYSYHRPLGTMSISIEQLARAALPYSEHMTLFRYHQTENRKMLDRAACLLINFFFCILTHVVKVYDLVQGTFENLNYWLIRQANTLERTKCIDLSVSFQIRVSL